MGGKLDVYIDCGPAANNSKASPYSYFALFYLRRQRKLLEQYGVEIEFHPVFLGGINVATGNKPPGTLPAKASYSTYDLSRALIHFQIPQETQPFTAPPFFPLFSILPQRTMLVIKSRHPREKYESVYESLWTAVFHRHVDIAKPEALSGILMEGFDGDEAEVREVLRLSTTQEFKDALTEKTKIAVEKGAFGAPWIWMRNDETGKEEPCFGSDRWSYIFRFMGVPVRELEIVDKLGIKERQDTKL